MSCSRVIYPIWESPARLRSTPVASVSVLGARHHANHLYESHHRAKDDSSQEEPVGVQPVVEQFADQESYHHSGGNNERDFGIARPHYRRVVRLRISTLLRHAASLSLLGRGLHSLRPY